MKKDLGRIIEKAKAPKKIPVSMYLDAEQFSKLKSLCKKEGISVSNFIDALLQDLMENPSEYPRAEKTAKKSKTEPKKSR